MSWQKWGITFLLATIYLPLLWLLFQPLGAYSQVLQNPSIIESARNSLVLAVCASLGSLTLAFLVLYFDFKKAALTFLLLMGVPEILMALSLLLSFLFLQKPLGFYALLLSHLLLVIPFVYVILKMGWEQIPQELLESAKDLGASSWQVLLKIQLPLMFSAIGASFVLSFLLSFDDFILSYYLGGVEYETLPVKILTSLKIGLTQELKALSGLLLMLSFALLFWVGRWMINKKEPSL